MKLIGRKVFSLLDMIHTLMGTNRRAFSLKPIFLKPYLRLRDFPVHYVEKQEGASSPAGLVKRFDDF